MTDKQIIIDGVDVSGCVQFIQDEKDCCNLGGSCKGWTNCYYKNWKRKEQECEALGKINKNLLNENQDLRRTLNEISHNIITKEQECKRLKWYLNEIRDDELKTLDIEWDEYETHCIDTEYSNIINLVEEALEERSPEDCRYIKD